MPVRAPIKRATRTCKLARSKNPPMLSAESEFDERPELIAEIEKRCLALFERWCEYRRVVPLAYLMHAWPIPTPNALLAQRLSSALCDLLVAHCESLDPVDRELILDTIEAIERIMRR